MRSLWNLYHPMGCLLMTDCDDCHYDCDCEYDNAICFKCGSYIAYDENLNFLMCGCPEKEDSA